MPCGRVESFARRHAVFCDADLDVHLCPGASRQLDAKLGLLLRDRRGYQGKCDLRRAYQIVEAAIRELHRCPVDDDRQILAALLAYMPLHLEDVGEIGAEHQLQRHLRVELAEVRQLQLFVQAAARQKPAALDVNDTLGNRTLTE